jgi:hypothetical protein
MARYGYVLTIYHPNFTIPKGLKLEEMAQGMSYTLYRVVHTSGN